MPINEVSAPVVIKIRAIILVTQTNQKWRVIYADAEKTVLCLMNVKHLELRTTPSSLLLKSLQNKTTLTIAEDDTPIIDVTALPHYAKQKYQKYQEIIISIVKVFGPEFTALEERGSKRKLIEIGKHHECSENTVRKVCRRYLQGGLQETAMIDKRFFRDPNAAINSVKRGRKPQFGEQGKVLSADDYSYFDEAVAFRVRNKGKARGITWQYCYDKMIELHYRIAIESGDGISFQLLPANQRPTFNQFYRYALKRVDLKALEIADTSELEYLNDKRLQRGSVRTNKFGPGDVFEIDACETDVALVSRDDPSKAVGRAIVYVIIDVYTATIVSVSVAFNNNSLIGLTNAVANLIADKMALCAKHDVTLPTTELWPSGFIPASVRIDHGADFVSKDFIRICKELGISVDTVPVMNGSMKGTVEHIFRTLHEKTGVPLIQKGQITKRYDSKHHKEAILNIEDFTKIVYEYVIFHNNHYIPSRMKEKEQIEDGIPSIPAKMWEYYTTRFGGPRLAPPKDSFLYILMKPAKGSVSKRKAGIEYNGLFYDCEHIPDIQHQREHLRGKVKKIDIRIDQRTTSYIYVLRDGKLIACPLNRKIPENASYADMTWTAYDDIRTAGKKMDHDNEEYNLENRIALDNKIESVVNEANQRHAGIKNATKNILENRAVEKEKTTVENSLQNKFLSQGEEKTLQVINAESEYLGYTNGENVETEEARKEKIRQSALDYLYDD